MRTDERRVEPPALDALSDLPLYNTKAVVHQTGVPAPTLRAWERRYSILTPQRSGNDYRLYSARDIATVIWLREQVQTGLTISQAIALLKSLQAGPPTLRVPAHAAPRSVSRANVPVVPSAVAEPPSFVLGELQATLLFQLANFDEVSVQRTISCALAAHSVEVVCTDVLAPVLVQVGQLWADGELSVVTEHFASNVIRSHLQSIFRSTAQWDDSPLVLVGCAPAEQHEIGALMLALFLRRAGVHAAYLGQNVEPESLLHSIHTLQPAMVVLSAVMPESRRTIARVARLISGQHDDGVMFGFGGPAFVGAPEGARAIPGTFLDADLAHATTTIRASLCG